MKLKISNINWNLVKYIVDSFIFKRTITNYDNFVLFGLITNVYIPILKTASHIRNYLMFSLFISELVARGA